MDSRLLTARQVADYLSVSTSTLRRMVQRGDVPRPIMYGGQKRWDKTAIDRELDAISGRSARFLDPDEALREAGL